MIKRLIRTVLPEPILRVYHYTLAQLAAFWFRHPSEELIVIGVTGTNGKSSTTQFIGRLLESSGERVGWTTTASFKVAEHEWVNDKKMTMLGRFQTQKLLREMVTAGCTYAIVETSSQGIVQSRHIGINYDVVAFTNLTPEHIEAHGGFENYKNAKGKLFDRLHQLSRKVIDGREIDKCIVVNLDDAYAEYFLSFNADRYAGVTWKTIPPELIQRLNTTPVEAQNVHFEGNCTTFSIADTTMHFKPIGRFQLENVLVAIATLVTLGVHKEVIQLGVESLQSVPGRLEQIEEGQPFSIIVDYAYEPVSLVAVYEAINLLNYKRLIHITGSAGGGRDVARREILGTLSAEHDDIVIVTNEDPYDEDPMQIVNHVADAAVQAGKRDGVDLFRILDRQEAINFAVGIAEREDLVLVTGKGSEPVMAVAHGVKIPWDDRLAVKNAVLKKYGRT
ncbi:UDP-N-acetylmuramyl-tripeptide synthetase [Candidatus Uhrbacteria bacterium]|nr:UDP-N-acetylmuramyl-tripeptide synthetase [Candidatus Uhrbacteria bacterium]